MSQNSIDYYLAEISKGVSVISEDIFEQLHFLQNNPDATLNLFFKLECELDGTLSDLDYGTLKALKYALDNRKDISHPQTIHPIQSYLEKVNSSSLMSFLCELKELGIGVLEARLESDSLFMTLKSFPEVFD